MSICSQTEEIGLFLPYRSIMSNISINQPNINICFPSFTPSRNHFDPLVIKRGNGQFRAFSSSISSLYKATFSSSIIRVTHDNITYRWFPHNDFPTFPWFSHWILNPPITMGISQATLSHIGPQVFAAQPHLGQLLPRRAGESQAVARGAAADAGATSGEFPGVF